MKFFVKINESKIKRVLSLLERKVLNENKNTNYIYLDTSIITKDSQGNIVYGNQSEGSITYTPVDKHFTTDIHGIPLPGQPVVVINKQSGNKMYFSLIKIDKDGSGEDIYGWNYKCVNGKGTFTLLVVND